MNYVRGKSNMADSNNSQFLMLNGTYVIYYSLNPIMIHIGFFFFLKGCFNLKSKKFLSFRGINVNLIRN